MIIIGVDPHKHTHTAIAIDGGTGECLAELTVKARREGHERLLTWARALAGELLFALEDVRRCSGALERFLVLRGEESVRVPPKLMGASRKGQRTRGKSDAIDALAVARAALTEPDLPRATLVGPSHEIALLSQHRDDLIRERNQVGNRLRWHIHDLDPDRQPPPKTLRRRVWIDRVSRYLASREQSTQVRVARSLVRRIAALNREIRALEEELGELVAREAPKLLTLFGCGPISAAWILAEVAGVERFGSEAKLAMAAGVAPIQASSGTVQRHRLNRYGNRRLNRAIHYVALTQGRHSPEGRAYLAKKKAEGKSPKEALRCLKRHLVRRIYRLLLEDARQAAARPSARVLAS
ncbi:MAG: IS110 family transposase [Thermoleophilaceae bacterium]